MGLIGGATGRSITLSLRISVTPVGLGLRDCFDGGEHAAMSESIRPFTVEVSDEAIADLRARLGRTRWPEAETVDDWTQGTPLAYAQELCAYWAGEYDWRRFESDLNAHPQFVTNIHGLDIHFLHIRSPHPDATPMIASHGWPGSVVEFMEIIGPLTNPTEYGGAADDAVDLVIPSLPGYGWSEKPSATGTSPEQIATMWDELMARLGYESYVAQGGDWGAVITAAIGAQNRGRVRAIHTNMPIGRPATTDDPTELEIAYQQRLAYYADEGSGYFSQQATRPQTLGYGLTDSPAGLAGWIVEKMWDWTDNQGRPEDAISRDSILDNISTYWFTGTAVSSARLYWEAKRRGHIGTVEIPTACSLFRHEILPSVRAWADARYTDIRYWNDIDEGGHFAAWERPSIFVDEIRAALKVIAPR